MNIIHQYRGLTIFHHKCKHWDLLTSRLHFMSFVSLTGACSDHECQYGAICVETFGTAHCECPICPAEFEPVCGSDGISYGNECKLRLEACKHRRDITVLYNGACSK